MPTNFAIMYEYLNDKSFYQNWYTFMQPYLTQPKNILDLGCGNGTLLQILKEQGHQVTGVDFSEDMLLLAAEKLGSYGNLFESDMVDFCSNAGQYDIIISTCDSLNYLSSIDKIEQVFHNVAYMLKKGGFFLFDVHSDYMFEQIFSHWSYGDAAEDISLIWNIEIEDNFIYDHYLTFYTQEENGQYQRFDALQTEYFYRKSALVSLLEKQQFSDIQYMSDFQKHYDEKGERTFFVCQKCCE